MKLIMWALGSERVIPAISDAIGPVLLFGEVLDGLRSVADGAVGAQGHLR